MTDLSGGQSLALLVYGDFDSGPFAAWTGLGDVSWGGVTYVGAGQLMSFSTAASAVASNLSGMTITLAGLDAETISIAETEPFQRRRVTVSLAVLNESKNVTWADVHFAALADTMQGTDDPKNPVLSMALEPRALDLQRARPFRYLPEDQKDRFEGDTFFDMVAAIQTSELTLGAS